jgi:hypothetical protein
MFLRRSTSAAFGARRLPSGWDGGVAEFLTFP